MISSESKNDREDRLTKRTIAICNKGGRILLKEKDDGFSKWYLSAWTNIAAGPDHANWGKRASALQFFSLQWAFAIAPLYDCKVVVVYPKKKPAVLCEESGKKHVFGSYDISQGHSYCTSCKKYVKLILTNKKMGFAKYIKHFTPDNP